MPGGFRFLCADDIYSTWGECNPGDEAGAGLFIDEIRIEDSGYIERLEEYRLWCEEKEV